MSPSAVPTETQTADSFVLSVHPAALRAGSFVRTAPVVGIAVGPQRGSETLTVWETEGECGKAKSEKASQ